MDLELWKRAKKQKGLTIAAIAERANLPKGSVQNIFAGYVPNPRVDTVEAIERALGICDKPQIENNLSDQEREIIAMYRMLPDKLKQLVVDQLTIFSSPKQ